MAKTEKDYLALARTKGYTPSRKKSWRRLFVYSRNKKGKTRLGLTAGRDNILVIDPEEGTDLMTQLDPFVWPVEKFADMEDVYGALRTGKLSPNHLVQGESSTPFTWVSPDGLTRIHNKALKHVMKLEEARNLDRIPGMVQQKDYGKANELMKELLIKFHSLPMHVYYTSQEKMITSVSSYDDDEDADAADAYYVPALPDGVRATINAMAEVIGRLYVVTIDGKDGNPVKQRRLQIGLHEKYDTGFRSEWTLPDVIRRPTLPKLVKLIEEGE